MENLAQLLEKILSTIQSKEPPSVKKVEEWLDNADIKMRLNISDSSVYRLRKKKVLPSRRISGKWYYQLPDFKSGTDDGRHPDKISGSE
ncbi:helix-turn-helix domain-containing protein [Pedobacter psychrodurus]|uniref:helix-turn-helix domain-containing protein n=1 Tax=Pedobacter psychrodurus TaxID=2530456 RepID=UPI00292D065D|nr:helix-turn-helix domain-containing protein [Pedobacter psychrodurus]